MNKQFLVLYIPEDDYAGVLPLPGSYCLLPYHLALLGS